MSYKILIADDEPMVIHGLCSQIDWESYNLELGGTAETAENALTILREKPVDILFTDICMPKMDGFALISAAKQENPFLRSVVISSHAEFCYAKKALLLGVENYLLKPIALNELNKTLEKTINNLDRDRIHIQEDGKNSSEFRNNILDRWVNADIQDYEFYERAELLHINLSAQQYQICVIDIIDSDTASQKLNYAKLLYEKYQSFFSPLFEGECFIDRCNRVVFVFYSDELCQKQEEIKHRLVNMLADCLKKGMKVFSSISSILHGVEDIPHNYSCAVDYLNYRFIAPDVNYIYYGEVLNIYNSFGCEPIFVQFTKALAQEDHIQIYNSVKKFFDLCSGASMERVKQCMVPFLILLVRKMNESGHMSEVLPSTATTGFHALDKIKSIKALETWFLDIVGCSLEVMGKRKKSLHLLVQRTIHILQKDYCNIELSLKSIAASFKVSPAYLGQLFREATGRYFNDYLTETRLQASRELLLETDLKIREILYHIGIPNQSYYNRIFKKAYGLAPLEFRYKKTVQNINS